MTVRIVTLAGVVSWVLTFGSPSAHGDEAMFWRGAGTATCGKFAKLYAEDPEQWEDFFFAWAQGYMSGLNSGLDLMGKPPANLARDIPKQKFFIRNYCDKHPLAIYAEAVLSLYDDLRAKQGLSDWRQ